MWFQAIFGLKTLSTFKRVRIIDHNELNNFLFGKERKTKNRNERRNKVLRATVFSEIYCQKFDSTQSLQVGGPRCFLQIGLEHLQLSAVGLKSHLFEFSSKRVSNIQSPNGSKRPVRQIKHCSLKNYKLRKSFKRATIKSNP